MATQVDKRYIALDVKCVATGVRHDARAPCFVALVDYDENIILEKKVKPEAPIVSYLTPLTGIGAVDLVIAENTDDVISQVKSFLGPDVILIGQNVKLKAPWLCLEEGKDFRDIIDLSDMFKTPYSNRYRSYTKYSLSHVTNTLLSKGILAFLLYAVCLLLSSV